MSIFTTNENSKGIPLGHVTNMVADFASNLEKFQHTVRVVAGKGKGRVQKPKEKIAGINTNCCVLSNAFLLRFPLRVKKTIKMNCLLPKFF